MNPDHLNQMALNICNRFNYPLPKRLTLSRRLKTSFGRAVCDVKVIEMNEWFVLNNREEIVEAVLKHEICHLRHCNHQKEFEQAVKIMGSSLHVEDLFDDILYPCNYVYKCPHCHAVEMRDRKYKKPRSCGTCGGSKFNEKFELILTQEK
jgi:predicted SprT family Zn-dependent metalloprotease